MREEESNWFSRWEEELPSPEELMPLSQTLITPDLAIAFDIRNPNSTTNTAHTQAAAPPPPPPPCSSSAAPSPPPSQPHSSDFDSTDIVSTAPGDEPARTLKRPRLVWTPQLHKRFVDAVAHLGIKNAVPKTIMQLMSVDGLTRENVASHLQKYRLYLKRMQGLSSGGVGNGGGNGALSPADAATDHLFASAPVPHHFLHPGRPPTASDHYLPFVPVTALQHHHQQQMAAAAVAAQQQYHHRQVGQFSSPPGRQFEHGFITGQQQQQPVHRMGSTAAAVSPVPAHQQSFLDDLDNGASGGGGGRKVLTLFPTGDD